MKFSGETKFNVGDTVYTAYLYHDLYAIKEPYVVSDIIVTIDNRGTKIAYRLNHDGYTERVPEEWLFNTYEECTKWCDKQNKKIG